MIQGLQAWYLEAGFLLVLRPNGIAVAVPFDAGELAVTGPETPVLEGIAIGANGTANLSVSSDGTLIYRAGNAQPSQRPVRAVRVTRSGQATDIDSAWSYTPGFNGGLSLSPDGSRLAVAVHGDPVGDIWIKELDRGPLSRVTFDNSIKYRPLWMPDGESVSYVIEDGQSSAILRRRADGGGVVDTVITSTHTIAEAAWSGDGSWLAYRITMPSRDIYAIRPGVDSVGFPVVASGKFDERAPTISPDGKWLAYQSDESGRDEIYIRAFPDSAAGRRQVSVAGGGEPLWAHSGRELFYRSTDGPDDGGPGHDRARARRGNGAGALRGFHLPPRPQLPRLRRDAGRQVLRDAADAPGIRPGEYGPAGVRGQLVHGVEGEDGEEVTCGHAPDAGSSLKRRLGRCR